MTPDDSKDDSKEKNRFKKLPRSGFLHVVPLTLLNTGIPQPDEKNPYANLFSDGGIGRKKEDWNLPQNHDFKKDRSFQFPRDENKIISSDSDSGELSLNAGHSVISSDGLGADDTAFPTIDFTKNRELLSIFSKYIEPERHRSFGNYSSGLGTRIMSIERSSRFGGLNPFLYNSTQDSGVEKIALGVVTDPVFVRMEAEHIVAEPIPGMSYQKTATYRYQSTILSALTQSMAGWALCLGSENLGFSKESSTDVDSIEAVREQINKVNFCPEQIEGIIRTGKVANTYVDGVVAKAEEIASQGFKL
jgi:hypothetical protein